MCNEHNEKKEHDYRFLDYRLDQLETNLLKGQEKLEQEQTNNYKELIKMLQIVQEGNNEQNKQLVELTQKTNALEEKVHCIDKLKESATKHGEEIRALHDRLDIYKQILLLVGTGAGVALLIEIIKFI